MHERFSQLMTSEEFGRSEENTSSLLLREKWRLSSLWVFSKTQQFMSIGNHELTAVNAGGPRQLAIRTV